MALMPGDGRYPISTFADLQYAIACAPHNLQAARAVRDFLLQAYCFRQMTGDDMDRDQHLTALEQLQEAQRRAAERGTYFILEWEGVTYHPPVITTYNPPAIPPQPSAPPPVPPQPSAPQAPAGVTFTSHQRVGDETRDSYIEHVHDMFARGFIDADEHDARLKALMRTHTREEMEFLIQDLPKLRALDQIEQPPGGKWGRYNLALAVIAGLSAVAVVTNAPPSLGTLVAFIVMLAVAVASVAIGLAMVKTRTSSRRSQWP